MGKTHTATSISHQRDPTVWPWRGLTSLEGSNCPLPPPALTGNPRLALAHGKTPGSRIRADGGGARAATITDTKQKQNKKWLWGKKSIPRTHRETIWLSVFVQICARF